jgi:hypothetical protein
MNENFNQSSLFKFKQSFKKEINECLYVARIGKINKINEDGTYQVLLSEKIQYKDKINKQLEIKCILGEEIGFLNFYELEINDDVIILFTDINYSNWKEKIPYIHNIDGIFNNNHNINNGIIISILNTSSKKIFIQNEVKNLQEIFTNILQEIQDTLETIKLLQTASGGFINSSTLDVHNTNLENKKEEVKLLLGKK